MFPADAFEPLRFALERAGIHYAIGGSWASTVFGEPRFTNGVDILADFTEETLQGFLGHGYLQQSATEIGVRDLLDKALKKSQL